MGRYYPTAEKTVGVFYSPSQLGHTHWGLTPLQSSSLCILQPKPTGPHSLRSDPSAEQQSVYSTAPANWANSVGGYPSADNQSVYSTTPTNWVTLIVGFYPSTIGIFYSLSQLGHTHRGGGLTPLHRSNRYIIQSPDQMGKTFNDIFFKTSARLPSTSHAHENELSSWDNYVCSVTIYIRGAYDNVPDFFSYGYFYW